MVGSVGYQHGWGIVMSMSRNSVSHLPHPFSISDFGDMEWLRSPYETLWVGWVGGINVGCSICVNKARPYFMEPSLSSDVLPCVQVHVNQAQQRVEHGR